MRAVRRSDFLKNSKTVKSEIEQRVLSRTQAANAPFLRLADDLSTYHALTRRQDFCALASEAGISERAAYSLIKIARVFEDYSDWERLERVGSTKLGIIAAAVEEKTTPRMIDRWLNFAENHTARECQLHLNQQVYDEETRCTLLRFTDRQYAAFANAVVKHGAKRRGKALIGVEKALISIIIKARRAESL